MCYEEPAHETRGADTAEPNISTTKNRQEIPFSSGARTGEARAFWFRRTYQHEKPGHECRYTRGEETPAPAQMGSDLRCQKWRRSQSHKCGCTNDNADIAAARRFWRGILDYGVQNGPSRTLG